MVFLGNNEHMTLSIYEWPPTWNFFSVTGDASAMRQLAEGYAEEIKEIVEKNSELKTSNTELVTFFPHLYSRSKCYFPKT